MCFRGAREKTSWANWCASGVSGSPEAWSEEKKASADLDDDAVTANRVAVVKMTRVKRKVNSVDEREVGVCSQLTRRYDIVHNAPV